MRRLPGVVSDGSDVLILDLADGTLDHVPGHQPTHSWPDMQAMCEDVQIGEKRMHPKASPRPCRKQLITIIILHSKNPGRYFVSKYPFQKVLQRSWKCLKLWYLPSWTLSNIDYMSGHGSIQVNRDSTNSYSWMRDFFLTSVPEWLQEARTGICLSTGWTRWKMINGMLTKSRSVIEKRIGLGVHNLSGDSSLSFQTWMVTGRSEEVFWDEHELN